MTNELIQLKSLLESSNRFIVLAHKSPDGDAVGSAAAFFHFLSNLSCSTKVVLPDPPSDTTRRYPNPLVLQGPRDHPMTTR